VTVYDYCHPGHASLHCLDVVRRYLQWRGYNVQYVQNFTDIDDKILNRARLEGSSMEAVAERFIQAYFEDMARLNIKEDDPVPLTPWMGLSGWCTSWNKGYAYPAAGMFTTRCGSQMAFFRTQIRRFASRGEWAGQPRAGSPAPEETGVTSMSDLALPQARPRGS